MKKLFEVEGYNGVPLFVAKDKIKSIQRYTFPYDTGELRNGPFTILNFIGNTKSVIVNEDVETVINRFEYT